MHVLSGLEDHKAEGKVATYNRAGVTSATTRTRGTNGTWEAVESVFTRSSSRARGTLEGGRKRGLEEASSCFTGWSLPGSLRSALLVPDHWVRKGTRRLNLIVALGFFFPSPNPTPERRSSLEVSLGSGPRRGSEWHDLHGDQQGQMLQKDLVHQESPVGWTCKQFRPRAGRGGQGSGVWVGRWSPRLRPLLPHSLSVAVWTCS